MAARIQAQPLTTGGFLWGPRRVALGVSLRRLVLLSKVDKGTLSRCEAGRLIPTPDQYAAVVAALDAASEEQSA